MDSHNWYDLKDVKREVLPDGRIRYYAEEIVEERVIDVPIDPDSYQAWMAAAAKGLHQSTIKQIIENDPYLNLIPKLQ